VTEGN